HREIAKGFGVSATPTLVIDGQIIQGFNQKKLADIINTKMNSLSENKAKVSRGNARDLEKI
ncbi:hypothetical protein AZO1586I_2226, partial [Bathymodiolus thermophilus thioautotrophic gill symbiont]